MCWGAVLVEQACDPCPFRGTLINSQAAMIERMALGAKVCKGGHEGAAWHCMVQYIISWP